MSIIKQDYTLRRFSSRTSKMRRMRRLLEISSRVKQNFEQYLEEKFKLKELHYYKGWLNQVPTYLSIDLIKDSVMKGQVEILSKTSTNMRIRIMSNINVEIHNEEYLEIQSLKKRVKQLEDDVKENENLKKKVKALEEEKKIQWVEQDLNSTQPFDINCVYRIKYNNNYTVICTYVDVNYIYHFTAGNLAYNIHCTNRKSSTTKWTVNQIWKQKIQ